jgi:hypothetical protein
MTFGAPTTVRPMCMQCVAQSSPYVGIAMAMLNRRSIRGWATTARQKIARTPPAGFVESAAGAATLESVPAPDTAPSVDAHNPGPDVRADQHLPVSRLALSDAGHGSATAALRAPARSHA